MPFDYLTRINLKAFNHRIHVKHKEKSISWVKIKIQGIQFSVSFVLFVANIFSLSERNLILLY